MSNFCAISPQRHGQRRWLRPKNYGFSAKFSAVPITGGEVAKTALSMPIAFVQENGHFLLSAMLSIFPDQNMFVGPDGSWLLGYIPASIRSFPFHMLRPADKSEKCLCIDEESGLVTEITSRGEAFFADDGSVSPALQIVLSFQMELERGMVNTDGAVMALVQAGLIVPWPLTVNSNGEDQIVQGLFRIDEVVLNALDDQEFLKLRAAGALLVAYGQLFSMGQLSVFQKLAQMQPQQISNQVVGTKSDNLDHIFGLGLDTGGSLKFD